MRTGVGVDKFSPTPTPTPVKLPTPTDSDSDSESAVLVVGMYLPCYWLRAEREARSEFFCSLRQKSQYARPDPTQPDPTQPNPTRPNPTRPHHAFEKLISLERVDRFTSGLLCSMSPFNKFRIWPVPIPTGASHGTWHVPGRGCRRHPLPR